MDSKCPCTVPPETNTDQLLVARLAGVDELHGAVHEAVDDDSPGEPLLFLVHDTL